MRVSSEPFKFARRDPGGGASPCGEFNIVGGPIPSEPDTPWGKPGCALAAACIGSNNISRGYAIQANAEVTVLVSKEMLHFVFPLVFVLQFEWAELTLTLGELR